MVLTMTNKTFIIGVSSLMPQTLAPVELRREERPVPHCEATPFLSDQTGFKNTFHKTWNVSLDTSYKLIAFVLSM